MGENNDGFTRFCVQYSVFIAVLLLFHTFTTPSIMVNGEIEPEGEIHNRAKLQ